MNKHGNENSTYIWVVGAREPYGTKGDVLSYFLVQYSFKRGDMMKLGLPSKVLFLYLILKGSFSITSYFRDHISCL